MNWIQIALQLLQLAPSILQMIAQVEVLFGAGNGPAKKAMVLAPLALAGASAPVTDMAGKFVDTVVTAANAAGVFKKAA